MRNKEQKDLMGEFRRWCRAHGFRVTPQRLAIYEELMQSRDHPSPEMLFSRLQIRDPQISLDTVYRTLATFHEKGLVDMVEGFALTKRFDPNQSQHHHARCTQCNAIIDFTNQDFDQLNIPASIRKSFRVKRVCVTIEGLCQECQAAAKKKASARSKS